MSEVIETTVVESTNEAVEKTRVTERQQELSEKIESAIVLDEDGNWKADKKFVEEILGKDSMQSVKEGQAVATDFTLALGLALGRKGVSHMKEHATVDVVSATIPFGSDNIVAAQQRSAEVGLGMGSDEKKTVHGRLTMAYKKKLPNATVKEIRTNISAMAAGILA